MSDSFGEASVPWASDHDLTEAAIRAALHDQHPEVSLDALAYLGSGWDYDAWSAGPFVVRFPRRAEVAARLDREAALLDFVSAHLPDMGEVRTPRITLWGEPAPGVPHRFFGHRRIEGVGLDRFVGPSAHLASDIGAALAAIHSVEFDAARAAAIPPEEEALRERYAETIGLLRSPAGDVVADLVPGPRTWLLGYPVLPPEFSGTPRFIHNDICPDHLIVDPARGRLVGVIDWSDAATGDPVMDFVLLALWGGFGFVDDARSNYPHDLDDDFDDRLRFLARTLSLKWLADAVRRGGDVAKHVAWVHNAFR